MAEYEDTTRGWRRVLNILGLTLLGVFVVVAAVSMTFMASVGWILIGLSQPPRNFRDSVPHPDAEFTQYTGFAWPASAKILAVGDDHGGMNGDGEFYLVFDVDRQTLDKWLAAKPPWGEPAWQGGGVPGEIAGHCRFGERREFSKALAASDLVYCAQDFKLASIPWHNGRVLAINRPAGRVYLSWWDF